MTKRVKEMDDILIISNYYPPEKGAAANRIEQLALKLHQNNYKVSVLCPLGNYPKGELFPEYKGKFSVTEKLQNISIKRLWIYPSVSKNIFKRTLSVLSFSSVLFFYLLSVSFSYGNYTDLKVVQDTLKNPKFHQDELVFTAVEKSPEYKGGSRAMYKFLNQNIEYPSEAIKNKISGKVFLRFIVEKDGSLSDIQLMKGIGFGCDLEAIRVVKAMPNWIPGMNGNNAVRCFYNLPISFSIR